MPSRSWWILLIQHVWESWWEQHSLARRSSIAFRIWAIPSTTSSPSSNWRWHHVGRFVAILLELFVALACRYPCVACYVHEYRPRYSKTFKVSFRSRSTLYSLGRGLSERSALLILCSRSSTMTGASAMGASCDDDSDWTWSQEDCFLPRAARRAVNGLFLEEFPVQLWIDWAYHCCCCFI